ncbi:hypothetical protein [Stenotrophomonas sp. GZD-301]|uniref:hypothetical protein n=1 Tax=Stenotrophomonas sp. GZD-301 TaxID=3404814 RepID=UPI003BB75C19
MQARKITLIEIGAGALPSLTPAAPRQSSWFPVVYTAGVTPPVDGVVPNPVADGVLIEWAAVDQAGVVYIIERGPTQEGPWTEIHRTTETRYLYSDGSGQAWWFKITASVRGKPGEGSIVEGTPGKVPSYAEIEELNRQIGQERIDRFNEDARVAAAAAAEAPFKANLARDVALARADAVAAQVADILEADEWTVVGVYPVGDLVQHAGRLYRARVETTGQQPDLFPAVWELIGEYASLGEAVAGALSMTTVNAGEIEAQASQLQAIQVRMPVGAGAIASEASVIAERNARVSADEAQSSQLDAVKARMPAGSGGVASEASVVAEAQARATGDAAQSQRTDAVVARLPAGNGSLASQAGVTAVEQASVDRDNALGQRIEQTNAALEGKAETSALLLLSSEVQQLEGAVSANSTAITQVKASTAANPNMIANPTWRSGFASWTTPASGGAYSDASFGPFAAILATASNDTSYQFIPGPITPGRHTLSGDIFRNGLQGNARLVLSAYNSDGLIGSVTAMSDPTKLGVWTRYSCTIDAPAGTTRLLVGIICEVTDAVSSFRRLKLELGAVPTVWSDEVTVGGTASATQALEVRATTLENGQSQLQASYTWALNVNGQAIGMTSVNNGNIGRIDFVADIFGIVDPNNTGSSTYEGGRWLTRSGGYMLAHGKPFGTSGDLLFWIGVGSNVAACSKANGLFWVDNKGNGYFGGSLSAGIRRNAYRSTAVSTTATVESPPFGTGGAPKTVVFSLAYYNSGYLDSGTPGVVANSAIMTLQRSYNGGAWETVSSMQVGGQTSVYYDDLWGRYSYEAQVGGSVTFTDGLPGTGTFAYRVLLSGAAGLWPITLAEANGSNFHIGSQELSLISTEA